MLIVVLDETYLEGKGRKERVLERVKKTGSS